jgi:site-specific recombinase XerD
MNFNQYLQQRNYSLKTIDCYNRLLTPLFDWLKEEQINITEISYADLLAYIKHASASGNSKRYVTMKITVIRHYLNYLVKTKEVKDNIAANLFIKGSSRRLPHDLLSEEELDAIYTNYKGNGVTGKRNKVILGLMVYQGLGTQELAHLEEAHLKLKEGKIYIPGNRRSNSRILELKGHQVLDLQEYTSKTRKLILELSEKETSKLFISAGTSNRFTNVQARLLANLKKYAPQLKNMHQIRSSVMANWVQQYNLREAQYRAGHRYVSSTERYQQSNADELKKDVQSFHPFKANKQA